MEIIVKEIVIKLLGIVGLYALLWWCYENFKSVFQIIFGVLRTTLLPGSKSLVDRYGKWAGKYRII